MFVFSRMRNLKPLYIPRALIAAEKAGGIYADPDATPVARQFVKGIQRASLDHGACRTNPPRDREGPDCTAQRELVRTHFAYLRRDGLRADACDLIVVDLAVM